MSNTHSIEEPKSTPNRYGLSLNSLMDTVQNNADLPLLGAVCWFDLQSGASRTAMDNALSTVNDTRIQNIIRENLPPEPKADQSFSYAIANAATGLKGVQTAKLEATTGKVIASILQREEQGSERVDFVQRSRVALLLTDRNGNHLPQPMVVHEVAGDPVGERIESLYKWHRDHLTPDDIRPMVTKTFEAAERLILRRAGGTYFVPAPNLEIIRELFALLGKVRCSGYFLPIFETTDALETLGQCATEDAMDDIAALMDELERFDEQLNDGKAMREKTLEARLGKLDDLRSKTALYARILKHDVERIESKFDEAQKKLSALIVKREDVSSK